MRRKTVSATMLSLLLIGMLFLTFNIQPAKGSGTIYIRPEGSIDPPTANVTTIDNVTYTFTGNIIGYEIVVERDNIVVDGVGYTLQGTGSGKGITLSGRSNVTIKNMETKAFAYGIWLSSSSNSVISGNNITNNDDGIHLVSSSGNIISANKITNNLCGVALEDSSNNTVSWNNITNKDDGIVLAYSSNNTISGNNVTNRRFNIYLGWSSSNAVYGNNVTNAGCGIVVGWSSSNTVYGNNLTNNLYGVHLEGSSNNTVSGNNIAANDRDGITVNWSSNNSIYHNNFVDNTRQVYSYKSVNIWDDNYPSGGNYWSDYTGVDVKSGPNQDQPGSDGIGDTPYVIDENDRDRYPLMHTGPYHQLTVTSSPITGITFTINDATKTTPYTEWILEGSYTLEMPETHNGYVWSHWLEDGDTNRTKTVTLNTNITLTGVFTLLCDLNDDGIVDMRDISIAARAFGSYPGHPRWNPIADINKDNKVDMRDIATVARNFGKTA